MRRTGGYLMSIGSALGLTLSLVGVATLASCSSSGSLEGAVAALSCGQFGEGLLIGGLLTAGVAILVGLPVYLMGRSRAD